MIPVHVAVFAFNRPDNLTQTLAALADNELADQSDVTIFAMARGMMPSV